MKDFYDTVEDWLFSDDLFWRFSPDPNWRFSPDSNKEYLQGRISQRELAERYGMGETVIRDWLRLYRTFGREGLFRQKHTTKYNQELKHTAVKAYLAGRGSLRELCCRYGTVQTGSYAIGSGSIMDIRKVPQSCRILNNGRKETS